MQTTHFLSLTFFALVTLSSAGVVTSVDGESKCNLRLWRTVAGGSIQWQCGGECDPENGFDTCTSSFVEQVHGRDIYTCRCPFSTAKVCQPHYYVSGGVVVWDDPFYTAECDDNCPRPGPITMSSSAETDCVEEFSHSVPVGDGQTVFTTACSKCDGTF